MEFYYLINVIMLVRLFYGFIDNAITAKILLAVIIMEVLLLSIFEISLVLFALLLIIIISDVTSYYFEKNTSNINKVRLLSFVFSVVIISLFTSKNMSVNFNHSVINFFQQSDKFTFLLSGIRNLNWFNISIVLTGLFLLLNEVNIFIRYIFSIFSLTPILGDDKSCRDIEAREYNAGRIIGMLERIIIYFFVLDGQYAAIGFIIAAKGFTRFKALDDQRFAEYVLIGTFISSLSAILVAVMIKKLI
ncbi:MAG: hypothetical protein ACYCVH_14300 [Ignavibacteriaceae bacterium]